MSICRTHLSADTFKRGVKWAAQGQWVAGSVLEMIEASTLPGERIWTRRTWEKEFLESFALMLRDQTRRSVPQGSVIDESMLKKFTEELSSVSDDCKAELRERKGAWKKDREWSSDNSES